MAEEKLYESGQWTEPGGFTDGVEGPACDRDGNLYAVNFQRQGTVGRMTPEGRAEVFLDLPAGSVGNGIRFNSHGEMLIADYVGHNVLKVEMASRRIDVLAHGPSMNQPNDLAIDAGDRIYASDPNWKEGTGQIWRIDPDGTLTRLEADMGTTNGIEVSPGQDRLYVNESVQRRIWIYDLRDGAISGKRLFVQFPDYGLDGMRCDVRGNLFVTRHGKGCVAMVNPDGEIEREIRLAGLQPTNLTFGGPDRRTCYVTVADRGNIERFRVAWPGRE